MSDDPVITAVIPVRLSTDRLYDEPERIARIVATLPRNFTPLIVDYGTAEDRAGELRDLAAATGTRLIRVETSDQPFSVGHARDIGTQHAETPLVLYHDIDFLMSSRCYERVLEEARLRGMPENAYAFFALPGVYLTEDFTRRYLDLFAQSDGDAAFADTLVHDGVMRRDRSVYENHTYAISAIVANRYHLLAIGGHDKSFVGHGAEDFELLHRLASYAPRGPKTLNYYRNAMNNSIQRYEGFRAYFALYGIDLFQRGLQVAHLWHPRRQDTSYVTPRFHNQERVSQIMADYDAGKSWVPALEDPYSSERTLVLLKDETAPALGALRHAFPAFGRYEIRREADLADAAALISLMDEMSLSRVCFLNPYGNKHRLSLYKGVKAAGRRFIVWDRGGLNDSWFFDPGGFLAESSSYSPEQWDKPLAAEKSHTVQTWLKTHEEREPLEKNGERIGAAALRERLRVGGKTIVFAALQRPLDTATVYFSGPCGDADGFNRWLAHLAGALDPERYVVVAKKHPLEAEKPEIAGVSFAEDSTHIMDLIEAAQAIVTINSGVGLIALGYGKPVICCGDAYYAHPGLAVTAASQDVLVDAIRNPVLPDEDKRLRFFHYLIEEFYSFGKARYLSRKTRSGVTSRLVRQIAFSSLCGLTPTPIHLGKPPDQVTIAAPLYYSFGGKNAVRLATTRLNVIVEKGEEARRLADYDKAAEMFEIARSRAPENDNFLHRLREIDVQRYGGPLEEMMSVSVKALTEQAEAAFATQDFVEAARVFEMLHLREPNNPHHLRCLADCYLKEGARRLAVRCLEKALALRPQNRAMARRLQEIRRPWHLLEVGVQGYGGPLEEMMSVPVKALTERAEAAFAAQDFAEAARVFEMLHLREPNNPHHLRSLAECYLKEGARRLAARCLEQALALRPQNRAMARRLQEIRRPWHLLEVGVQGYGGLLEEMMSVSVKALTERAEAAFAAQDFAEAARVFEMLHLREPNNPHHLRCLAECYLKDGARRLAARCLEKALALKAQNKGISRRLREVRRPWWKRLYQKEEPFPVKSKT